MKQRKRVLVGMSGGTDSSAACLILQEQGFEVVGITMRVWDLPRQFSVGESLPTFILEAQTLAHELGIEHHIVDERVAFREIVVKNFIDEYMNGRTPNPCVLCNPLFKFRILTEWADRLSCPYISTGHYVRKEYTEGKVYIVAGVDIAKDQSYFLWRLDQTVLSRCIFPLGTMLKSEVRDLLEDRGYVTQACKSESMETCFVEHDYRDFLRQQLPDLDQRVGEGWFVDKTGNKLGIHKGVPFYTVGQRKGLGIALGRPAYVLRLNAEKNTVMLGSEDELVASAMFVEQAKIVDRVSFFRCSDSERLSVRIRYHSKPVPCKVQIVDDGRWLVRFGSPVSAVTPGQSAVFYADEKMLGGAYIASQRGLGVYLNS